MDTKAQVITVDKFKKIRATVSKQNKNSEKDVLVFDTNNGCKVIVSTVNITDSGFPV